MNDFSSRQTAVLGKRNFTDRQLCDRWHCSPMKRYRLRKQGLLRSFKAGGVGRNLTPEDNVEELEGQKSRCQEADIFETAEAGAT
jgi:hypothetical protein